MLNIPIDIALVNTNCLKWIIACHLRNAMRFSANTQMPDKLHMHPPNIYVLELSPASMKCTHDVVVKLFCRLLRFSSGTISDECDG
jgi:hypothetical protein